MNICRWTAPPLLRASGYGAMLTYLREAEANQWKSRDEILHIQWDKVAPLLDHAARRVPYYRTRFKEAGVQPGDIKTREDFARLPELTRQVIQEQSDAMLAEGMRKEDLILRATSGSTGQPTFAYIDRDKMQRIWSYNLRHNRWAGFDWGARVASYWTVYADHSPQRDLLTPLRRLKKHLQGHPRLLQIDPRDATEEERLDLLHRLPWFKPNVLVGYTNGLDELARLAERDALPVPPIPSVIPGAEALLPGVRERLERVFRGKVYNRYGTVEVEIIASECASGSMHVNEDNLLLELVPCPDNDLAKVLITDLHNYAMPLIRYDLNDYARWGEGSCACGRGLSVFARIDGRTSDMYRTRDNRVVTGLSFGPDVEKIAGVRLFQLIQKDYDVFVLRCVTDGPLRNADLQVFHDRLRQSFGADTEFRCDIVNEIPRTPGGKYKFYISEVA